MSLFRDAHGYVTRRVAGAKDHISMAAIGAVNNGVGMVSASVAFEDLRHSSKTFFARARIDWKNTIKSLRKMKKSRRHVQAFDDEYLAEVYKRYATHPKELNKHLIRILTKIHSNLNNFFQGYSTFVDMVHDELVKLAQDSFMDNEWMDKVTEQVVRELDRTDPTEGQRYNRPILHVVQKKLNELTAQKVKRITSSYREDQEEGAGKIRKGIRYIIFKPLFGSLLIRHNFKKGLSYLRKTKQRKFAEAAKEVSEQAEKGLKPDFFSLVLVCFENMEIADELRRELHHDIMLFLDKGDKEYQKLDHSLAALVEFFKKMPEFKSKGLSDIIQQIRVVHEKSQNIPKLDAKDEKTLYAQVGRLRDDIEGLILLFKGELDEDERMAEEEPEKILQRAA